MTTISVESAGRPRVKSIVKEAFGHPLLSYYLIIAAGLMLLSLGLLMVISSSSVIAAFSYQDPYYFGKRQMMFAGVGLIGAALLSRLSDNFLRKISWPVLLLALVLIILTFSPLGVEVNGNKNWLSFGPAWTQFQPSEFAKLALIIWGASDLARRERHLGDLRQWIVFLVGTFSIVGLVVLQKDQGTAMVIAAMVLIIMVAAGAPWRILAGICGLGVVAMGVLIKLQPYRMSRILAFLNPDLDAQGSNMQSRRGLYALASGGWFGQGLGASRQKWGLLAEAHTDYIFAIIGEELGLMGTLTVILLFAVLAYAGIRIAMRSASQFSRLLSIGVVAWFTVQGFINIAVAIRLVPVMGITLPMVSYGGSSLMANLFALGILAGCARREPDAAAMLASRRTHTKKKSIVRTAS